MSIFGFGLALLKLANAILGYLQRQGQIDEGRRQVILENSLELAKQVATKKQLQEHVDGLSDAEVDRELRDLAG
jgi:hypothetical protein